jgi:hypothetical protein
MNRPKSKPPSRGRGRPRKADDERASESLFVRGTAELKEAIRAFQKANMIGTESEAVRQLLVRALRAENLL